VNQALAQRRARRFKRPHRGAIEIQFVGCIAFGGLLDSVFVCGAASPEDIKKEKPESTLTTPFDTAVGRQIRVHISRGQVFLGPQTVGTWIFNGCVFFG